MVFKEFDSFEDMQAYMREAERQANERVTETQRSVGWGDHYIRVEQGIVIFSTCPTIEDLEALERSLGSDPDEWEYTRATMLDAHERGYRYGQHFSVVEPDGEWGSAHISMIAAKLTPEQFEEARRFRWNFRQMLDSQVQWAMMLVNGGGSH